MAVTPKLFEQLIETMVKTKKIIESTSHIPAGDKAATMLQYRTLLFLKHKNECTVGEMAEYLGLSKSSAAQLIDRLIKLNWIDRKNSEDDRRMVYISLTKTGEKELQELKRRNFERLKKILSLLPEKDLEDWLRIQSNLLKKLEEQK
jgi:DNA-binding MarR family transcriptional regulator